MPIEIYKSDLSKVDNTYGYDDMLLIARDDHAGIISDLTPSHIKSLLSGSENPSEGLLDADAEKLMREGDKIFRLPNGGLILRRSVFMDLCDGQSQPNNTLNVSESMARALAFFGSQMQGSDPTGDHWCRRELRGAVGNAETPWNVTSSYDLKSIEQVLSRILLAQDGRMPSDIPAEDRELAQTLAQEVTKTEMHTLSKDIKTRMERLEGFGEWFMKHPALHTIYAGLLFGLATDMYHIGRFVLVGGEVPWKGNRGFALRIYDGIRRAIDNERGPRPPSSGGLVNDGDGAIESSDPLELGPAGAPANTNSSVDTSPTEETEVVTAHNNPVAAPAEPSLSPAAAQAAQYGMLYSPTPIFALGPIDPRLAGLSELLEGTSANGPTEIKKYIQTPSRSFADSLGVGGATLHGMVPVGITVPSLASVRVPILAPI
jgi:hypothetical protein